MSHPQFEKWLENPEELSQDERAHFEICPECSALSESWAMANAELHTAPFVEAPADLSKQFSLSLAARKRQKYYVQVIRSAVILGISVFILSIGLTWWAIEDGIAINWLANLTNTLSGLVEGVSNIPYILTFWLGRASILAVFSLIMLIALWTVIMISTTGFFTYRVYKAQGVRHDE